jgi:hypothetical protein
LAKVLKIFYSLLFVDTSGSSQQRMSYNVKKSTAQFLVELLK